MKAHAQLLKLSHGKLPSPAGCFAQRQRAEIITPGADEKISCQAGSKVFRLLEPAIIIL